MPDKPMSDQEVEGYTAALEVATALAQETADFLQQNQPNLAFSAVQIVLGNPTVKEYKVTIVPGA